MSGKSPLLMKALRLRRRFCETVGIDRYSRPALNDLDRKLERYIDYDGGVFVELGANDGFTQSNTYYYEAFRGWHGILIEPIPALYEQARKNRPRAHVFNCACVSEGFEAASIEMTYSNLMSLVKGAMNDATKEREHVERGAQLQDLEPYTVQVPARTLTSILEECAVTRVDLLCLDVEGYEESVLKGLDFDRFAPRYMLIEARFRESLETLIGSRYEVAAQMSHHDVLYRRRN